MLVLAVLSALAWLSGLAVSVRLYPDSRAERALATAVIALAEIVGVIQALGWTQSLTPLSLAMAVLLLSLLVLCGTLVRREPRVWARELAMAAREQCLLPITALSEAWHEGSFATVSLASSYGIVAWTLWLAWLAPSGAWDGLWYHEPMVGFALETHGFAVVTVPAHLQWINGYPRTAEHLMLWLCAFSDRRLVDAVPNLVAPLAMLATYVIGVRYSRWRVGTMALACVLITIPGVVLQFRSTYIDVVVLATFMAALAFVTRPDFRISDVWLSALAMGLVGGTKSTGIFYVAVLGLVALGRVIALVWRSRSGWALAHAVPALAVLALLFAPVYVRNWNEHHNPIWPLRYESKLLGVTLEGPTDITNMQYGTDQVLHEMFDVPTPGEDYHDTRRHAYGYGLTFVGLPLFAIALFAALAAWLGAVARRDRDTRRQLSLLAIVVGVGTLTFLTSPAFYWARYSLPFPAVGLVLIGWLVGRSRWRALGEGALAAMMVLNLVTLWWAEPAWDVTPRVAWHLAQLPSDERIYVNTSHCLWPAIPLRLREERIGPHDLVVFDSQVAFIGNLWNQHFSNRVEFVPFTRRETYLAELERRHAKWIYAKEYGPEASAVRSVPGRWREIERGRDDEPIFERIR